MVNQSSRENDKNKLIQEIGRQGSSFDGSAPYEKAKAEFLLSCTEDLIKSINENSSSSHVLAKKIFWLNVILTSATIIGTIIVVLTFFIGDKGN